MKLILFLFWRDIINKLSSNSTFKLQLKLNLNFSNEHLDERESSQIRSIGSVRLFKKENFKDVLSYFISSLYLTQDNYSTFYVKDVILTYNICYEDSILNNPKLIKKNSLNELIDNPSKKMQKNKYNLKISVKNLPLTTDLYLWGNIKTFKGEYPYQFDLKETKILISNEGNTSDIFNYIISIRGFKFKEKPILIHKVSVTDKNFKFIHLNFTDISYDLNFPDSFVRTIDNNQYVYEKGELVLSQKRKKSSILY